MPTQALTTDFLNSLPSRSSSVGLMNYFDTETKGFMLEVRASGGATFYFRYRDPGGRIRMNRIGRRDEIALADARAKAHQMKKMVTEGGDPKAENHRFKDIPTFGEFFRERFLPFVKSRKRSWQTDEVLARHHLLPAFEALRLNRVTRADVLAFHQAAHTKGYAPGTCNRMLVLLKFMYNCAIRWEILPPTGNPCVGVDPLDDNGARERYLSAPEVQRLFEELDSNRNVQVAQVVRLLLYTGARIDAAEAHRLGIVDHVVPRSRLLEKCADIAEEIVRSPPLAVEKIRDAVMRGVDVPLRDALEIERENFDFLRGTEDAVEGAAAFAAKRAPVWRGR